MVSCLAQGEALLDAASKTTPVVAEEYAHYTEGTWSSKGMLELIRLKMSSAALDSDDKPSTSTSSPLGAISVTLPLRVHGLRQISIRRRSRPVTTQPQTSRACAGPLSEIGEVRDATEDTHSIYGDSDLMSSDGRDQVRGCNTAFLLLPERPSHGLLSSVLFFGT